MNGKEGTGVALDPILTHRRSPAIRAVGFWCLVAFVVVAVCVVGRAGNVVDRRVLAASPGTAHWDLARAMIHLRLLGAPDRAGPLAAVLGAVGLSVRRTRRSTLLAGCVLLTGVVVGTLLKYGLGQPGPPVVDGPPVDNGTAFPSGHTVLASLLYPCTAAVLATVVPRRALPVLVAGAVAAPLVVGLCQILLRTHWVSDVVAAWLFSAGWLALSVPVLDRLAAPPRGRRVRRGPAGGSAAG